MLELLGQLAPKLEVIRDLAMQWQQAVPGSPASAELDQRLADEFELLTDDESCLRRWLCMLAEMKTGDFCPQELLGHLSVHRLPT